VSESCRTWLQLHAAAEPARSVMRDTVKKDFVANVYATRRLMLGEANVEA
jgi:hypothetical protein